MASRTGYAIVDAGICELWRIGVMYNRGRMVVASLPVKHLMIATLTAPKISLSLLLR